MLIFLRLTGEPIFEAKDRKELLDINKKCEIDLNKVDPLLVNKVEKDLLSKMLQRQPGLRISAKKALEHEFFN